MDMSVEVAKRVVENLDKKIEEEDLGAPFFGDPRYIVLPLTKEGFRQIQDKENKRRIAFVDGGNHEVLGAPSFSVQINRVYYNIFEGQKRILGNSLPSRMEFFSVTHSVFRDNDIFYDTLLFPVTEKFGEFLPDEHDLSFSSLDRTVTEGMMRADISRVASIARRFAEWAYAYNVVKEELDKGDIIVLDGSLQTAFKNEANYSSRLYNAASQKGVVVTGLSKTSHLFTTTGLSLLGAVRKLADSNGIKGKWYFKVAEATSTDHNAVIFVTKLSPKAEYVFRYEIYRKQFLDMSESDVDEIFAQVARNSQDVCFPGYPYGLIDADRFARVRESEVGNFQVLLLSEVSRRGKWAKFAQQIRASDAHTILNMLEG
jgi:hypothetical protein